MSLPQNDLDRRIADMLGMSHRAYRQGKAHDYRLKVLAPVTLQYAERALEENWSLEKAAEWMDASSKEAAACLGRLSMSLEIGKGRDVAERLERAFTHWLSRFENLSKSERSVLARELNLHVGNQLDWAAEQGKTLQEVADVFEKEMELPSTDETKPMDGPRKLDLKDLFKPKDEQGPPTQWGPAWKD